MEVTIITSTNKVEQLEQMKIDKIIFKIERQINKNLRQQEQRVTRPGPAKKKNAHKKKKKNEEITPLQPLPNVSAETQVVEATTSTSSSTSQAKAALASPLHAAPQVLAASVPSSLSRTSTE